MTKSKPANDTLAKPSVINTLLIRRAELDMCRKDYIAVHNELKDKNSQKLTKWIINNLETEFNEIDRELLRNFYLACPRVTAQTKKKSP